MGASVGIGALIVGTSLLTIFALASAAIDLQVDEALERIEETGDNSVPSFTVDDASNDVNAVAGVTITVPGTAYVIGDIISSGSVASIDLVDGGTGYTAGNLVWTGGSCDTDPSGTYTVGGGGTIDSITLSTGGNGCTGTSSVDGDVGGTSSSTITVVMHSSFGFSAKVKTVNAGGGVTAVEMVSAGQGHTSAPNIFVAEDTGSGASLTAVLDNVLTWNMTNNGQEVLKLTHIWFALDGAEPEQLSTSTYTIWDFPKHEHLFPGESVMVSYDLDSGTPSRIAVSSMGGQSAKAVTQNG
ncbi:MAG: hypothetical protein ACKVHH_00150 [Candidatus Poseidoniales archaeon]